jgi:hypothetical protein
MCQAYPLSQEGGEEGSHSGNHSGTAPAPPRRRALWVLDELAVEMPWIIFNPLPQSLTVTTPLPPVPATPFGSEGEFG